MAKKNEERINYKDNLKQYFRFSKRYKWFFVGLTLLSFIVEGVYVFEKYLFKVVLDKGAEFGAGTLLRDEFVVALLIVGGIFLASLIVKVVGHWIQIHLVNLLDANLMFDLKKKFFDHIIHLHHGFHTTHKTGSLISKMNRGGRAIESVTDFFIFNVSPLVMQALIIGISLISFDWPSAIVIIATSILFIVFGIYTSKKQEKPQLEANNAEDKEKGNIADFFMNIDSIKYYGKEKAIKNRYAALAMDTKMRLLRFWDYFRWVSAGQSFILGIGTFFVVYLPLMKFLNGEMTIGTVAFIYSVYLSLMGPLFGFVHGMRKFYVALGDYDALLKYEKVKNEIKEGGDAVNLKVKEGEIEFRNITFKYKEKKANTINALNLKIRPHEKVALVGHSGCGKTTLVKLLYRFYDCATGNILIDKKDIKGLKQESLRSELSIVPQECILFDDTIYNNIAFSRPNASREEVMKAIKFAQLDKFVNSLPLKERTIVGERGVKLSGGEKQRVSIARAILANKKVLVLDEATSSLDSETEHEIQNDLAKLMQGRTSIIIAHRLSTIMRADRIIVMEKGRIVQMGNHWELIKRSGPYKNLWNLQKGGYIKE